QLKAAVAELEAFAYSLSLDMRGPLRAVRSYSAMLEEDFGEQLPEDAKKIVQRIGRSTERLEKMIGDVLTFSRMTLQPIAKEVVDVEAIIRVTLEHDSELQPPKATIYVQSPLPKLIGHEASLTQCVSNLLRNAVKFV